MPHDPAPAPVDIRRAGPEDRAAIVGLAGAALRWRPHEPNEALFAWKHDRNPFGRSPIWVAETEGRIVGVRALMRWEFVEPSGAVAHAVRAVDTATHPDVQGRGIFRQLTLSAVAELESEGVDFVFNTPNDQSRPGYLKMGWSVLGRVTVGVAVRHPRGLVRMSRARVPAGKWSVPTDAGEDAVELFGASSALADRVGLASALAPLEPSAALTTNRSSEFFAWRYADGRLAYRVLRRGRYLDDGFVVFRLRARGSATEATICDLVHPEADARVYAELVRSVLRETSADYAISVHRGITGPGLSARLPTMGPVFTWRPLARPAIAPLAEWSLRMGDVELF